MLVFARGRSPHQSDPLVRTWPAAGRRQASPLRHPYARYYYVIIVYTWFSAGLRDAATGWTNGAAELRFVGPPPIFMVLAARPETTAWNLAEFDL